VISDQLKAQLLEFRRARDWEQFHSPRNLAAAMNVEASELLEHYQWASDADITRISVERRSDIADEIADIAILLTYLANDLSFDLEEIVMAKLKKNAEKYPVAKSKGTSRKYDRL